MSLKKDLDAHIFDPCVGCIVWASHLFLLNRPSVCILQICLYGVNERGLRALKNLTFCFVYMVSVLPISKYRNHKLSWRFTLVVIETRRTLEEDMVLK